MSEDLSIGRILSEKKIWGNEFNFWKKKEALYAELKERTESASSSYSAADDFLQYIYSVLEIKNLVHEFSFKDIF